jgi:phosphoribosyl-ATP pyrophosphohydrolase/phosphoribosyl-AMP cyclohydrolase/histidinol dehydrogenase
VWEKGATSGATQELLRIDVDCDRDALRFTVRQHGAGFCHRNTMSCWSHGCGRPSLGLASIEQRLGARVRDAEAGSYTARLANDAGLLRAKLMEEAAELSDARDASAITHEAADVLYFAMTKLAASGVSLAGVARELERRTLRVTRRAGEAKSAVR